MARVAPAPAPSPVTRSIPEKAAVVIISAAAALLLSGSAFAEDMPIQTVFQVKCAGEGPSVYTHGYV